MEYIIGLTNRADDNAGDLPYGDQRKLEIVRAMCIDPHLLCLDEPAAGLNAKESAELNKLLLFIKNEKKTGILLIEHDMSVVMEISDHVVVLNYGKKIFQGSAKKEANSRITRRVIDSFLKDRKIAKGIARLGEGAIVQGLAEGGQEWSQHMVQTLSQFAYKNGYGDTEETAFEEFIKQATSPAAISSAHAGGTMGLLMGPVAVVGQQLSARQKAALKRDPMQQMGGELMGPGMAPGMSGVAPM